MILPFEGKTPRIARDAFIAPTAVIVGDVVIESGASVWFGAVLRGDFGRIRLGRAVEADPPWETGARGLADPRPEAGSRPEAGPRPEP